jgi:putative endonuclease
VKTYCVYIMASASRVLYTGVTNNIQRRVSEHREGRAPGFSEQYRTRELVHLELFGDVRVAIAREKQIKGWLRAKKIALIQSANPHWKDLSSEWRARPAAVPNQSDVVILSEARRLRSGLLCGAKNPSEWGSKRDSSSRKPGLRMTRGA